MKPNKVITITNKQLLLIKDNYDCLSILGSAIVEDPEPSWLAMQRKPFARNAIFHNAYPLSGGESIIDIKDIKVIREVSQVDIDNCAQNSNSFNPAGKKILKLWESPPLLPDFIVAQANK